MTEILPFKAGHLDGVELPDAARTLLLRHVASGPAFSGFVDGQLLGCAGLASTMPGVCDAWAIPVLAHKYPLAYARTTSRMLRQLIIQEMPRRVQTLIDPETPGLFRWMDFLGFHVEGRLRKAGLHGQDMLLYALIPEDAHGD